MDYSNYTNMFYLTIPGVEIKDGAMLKSVTEHRKTQEEAISAYYEALKKAPTIVVNAYAAGRKEYVFRKDEIVLIGDR